MTETQAYLRVCECGFSHAMFHEFHQLMVHQRDVAEREVVVRIGCGRIRAKNSIMPPLPSYWSVMEFVIF